MNQWFLLVEELMNSIKQPHIFGDFIWCYALNLLKHFGDETIRQLHLLWKINPMVKTGIKYHDIYIYIYIYMSI